MYVCTPSGKEASSSLGDRSFVSPSEILRQLFVTMLLRGRVVVAYVLASCCCIFISITNGQQVKNGHSKDADCPNCVDEPMSPPTRWTMPLLKLGEKRYYLGIFFRANWFRAAQYCRFHGMHLASIGSQEENDKLEKHIKEFGFGHEHFWTSGTDLAEEGNFFWMSTGRPITFENWNTGEPNNFRYENGEEENCLELWNRDGKGLKWNDSPCSFETYFVCEV